MQRFLETLETRRLLAVTASFLPSAGVLSVFLASPLSAWYASLLAA